MKTGTYDEIENRMLEISELKNTTSLAKSLSVTPQAMGNSKRKHEMPIALIIKFAKLHDCSVDYLLSGEYTAEEKGVLEIKMIDIPGEVKMTDFCLILRAQKFEHVKIDLTIPGIGGDNKPIKKEIKEVPEIVPKKVPKPVPVEPDKKKPIKKKPSEPLAPITTKH